MPNAKHVSMFDASLGFLIDAYGEAKQSSVHIQPLNIPLYIC